MAQETAERQAAAGPATCLGEGVGAPAALRRRLREAVEALGPELVALSHDIHEHPETGYQEYHAVAAVADLLRRHDLEPQVGVYGMDTALRAQVGQTGASAPTIAILCEYDALPGIGHGCGHNVMCASSVGAFLALAALDRLGWEGWDGGGARGGSDDDGARGGPGLPGLLPGRVVLQTTPAEENSTAKEILATRGMLDGVGAAVQTHSYAADVTHQTWLGVRRLSVVFHGVPAHASSQPFMGRNALDAATLALTGFGLLRQHILPMDRLHAVVVDGGEVANVIPERAELAVMVRSKYPETLKEIVSRVEEVLYGAALMTGTGVEICTDSFTNEMPVRDNAPLLESWVRSQRERGRDPLPVGVLSETIAAGTDFGNVSQRVPGIHPLVKVTEGPDVALHTREMAQAAASPTGDAAAVDGAYGLAAVSLDWLCDAGLREAVQADFEASGGVVDVEGFWAE